MLGFYRQLPVLGECLSTLVGAMPVAFLESHLNMHNPQSVFNTKTPRERASEYIWQDRRLYNENMVHLQPIIIGRLIFW